MWCENEVFRRTAAFAGPKPSKTNIGHAAYVKNEEKTNWYFKFDKNTISLLLNRSKK